MLGRIAFGIHVVHEFRACIGLPLGYDGIYTHVITVVTASGNSLVVLVLAQYAHLELAQCNTG